jgi:hypothetical protein
MRAFAVATLSLIVATAACSNPIDPGTATISGSVAMTDAAANRIGVQTRDVVCVAVTAPCHDYSVHVTGQVYQQDVRGRYHRITFADIPVGAAVLVWTTGPILESFPAQVQASRVVVMSTDLVVTRVGRP